MRKWAVGVVGVALAAISGQGVALADSSAAELPPTWHVHDCVELVCAPQHKPVSFFPAILDISQADYLLDPARCPNAVDKEFLPSFGKSKSGVIRAGVCMTSTTVIHLRTVPFGTSGPEGWEALPSEQGAPVTYFMVTPR
jgi:hypothetical protein